MCGICGILNFDQQKVDESLVSKMMQEMKHRGPDDDGIFIDENVGLGYVRLSIIDLSSAGHQPMLDNTGRYVMIFNGEIYNYIELREELKNQYQFKTQTDSEVLLAAYIIWGEWCLDKLNGMFSFVIYDNINKTIFAARDRFGVKPFYYYYNEDQFIFASEIQPILKVLKTKPEPDNHSIYDFLVFNRSDQTNATFFKDIKKLQHGNKLFIDLKNKKTYNKLQINTWYDLRTKVKLADPFIDAEEFREYLISSVKFRLRSDVPVGVCLSGGLDSSSLVSIMLKIFETKNLHTFSAVYGKGKSGDESYFIDLYKSQLDNMHYTTPTSESLLSDLDEFIKVHPEPIPTTSPYAQYKVMEAAKGNVVVLLDGQGADEELAGYHYFFGIYFKELLRKLKFGLLGKEMYEYYFKHHSFYGIKSFFYFAMPNFIKNAIPTIRKDCLNAEFSNNFHTNTVNELIYDSKTLNEALLDHFEYKLEHLLKWEDLNSMHFSIEARVPFLDYRLVEKVLALSSNMLIKDGTTKYIFREAMKDLLPEEIRTRKDKIGFSTPQDDWFRTPDWQIKINEVLKSQSFCNRNYINPVKANELYKQHLEGSINISKEIWKWIHLEYWFREYIDK